MEKVLRLQLNCLLVNNVVGTNYKRYLLPLFVFGLCGFIGILIDLDHFIICGMDIHCLFNLAFEDKIFHNWLGFVISLFIGLGSAYIIRYAFDLVDNSIRSRP